MKLLLVGASVRPLIRSALAAGHDVEAYDLFADFDSCELSRQAHGLAATITQLDSFDSILDVSVQSKPNVVILTGGIEQRLILLDKLGQIAPIAGATAGTIDALRDRSRLAAVFRDAGCRVADTKSTLDKTDVPDAWLRKPIAGAGGHLIRPACDDDAQTATAVATVEFIYQRRIEGESWSALFSTSRSDHKTALIGMTRQLIGLPQLVNQPFAYCGSIGPLQPNEGTARVVMRLGKRLAESFNLTGVFGVDMLLNGDEVWPVDINPRITASAELFEMHDRVTENPRRFNMIEQHLDRNDHSQCGSDRWNVACGKAIVFNREVNSIRICEDAHRFILNFHNPDFDKIHCSEVVEDVSTTVSDIPKPETLIPPGAPVLTVRAMARNETAVRNVLFRTADRIQAGLVLAN